jgi:hypothetical protein
MKTLCLRAASDTPTLYAYGELDDAARLSFEKHVARCSACAGVLVELEQLRVALAARGSATRTDADWSDFMRRLGDARPEAQAAFAQGASAGQRASTPKGARRVLVLAATLAIGMSLGLIWQRQVLVPRESRASNAASDSSGFDTAAARHFERAKLVVLGLAMKDPSSARAQDWEYERGMAASLLPETRLIRLSAADRGDSRLAGILGDLEAVLLQAAMSSDAEAPELQRIQRIIRGRNLIVRMDLPDRHNTRGL